MKGESGRDLFTYGRKLKKKKYLKIPYIEDGLHRKGEYRKKSTDAGS